jgi:hypothetical protein
MPLPWQRLWEERNTITCLTRFPLLHIRSTLSTFAMAPQGGSKSGKATKGSDLRMFFGSGGSQPKAIPRTASSQVRSTIFSDKRALLTTESSQILVHRKRLRVSSVLPTHCAVNLSKSFGKVAISMFFRLPHDDLLTPNSRVNPTPNTSRRYGLNGWENSRPINIFESQEVTLVLDSDDEPTSERQSHQRRFCQTTKVRGRPLVLILCLIPRARQLPAKYPRQ